MVNLQKSNYENFFYINYGYIFKNIPLDNEMMHIYNRVTSPDVEQRNRIKELLDLDSSISDEDRLTELKQQIRDKVVSKMQLINTEEDLLNELKKRPHLNDIPLVVKKHFKLQ
jgi:RNA recognition motif-containing protein